MTNFGLEKRFVNQFAQPFAGRISSFSSLILPPRIKRFLGIDRHDFDIRIASLEVHIVPDQNGYWKM